MKYNQMCSDVVSIHAANKGHLIELDTNRIERAKKLQGRAFLDPHVVADYAKLMEEGVQFPPVRVWFDGEIYWLSDGFHRVAAAEQLQASKISAQIFEGSFTDAQWDSYGSNVTHGLRRTREDVELIVGRALGHPNGIQWSTNQIAKHVGVPETTIRRWRKHLSSSGGEDQRLAIRAGVTYSIKTANIGKTPNHARNSSSLKHDLKDSLSEMKINASPTARRLLNIVGNWAFGASTATESLSAIENLIENLSKMNTRT